MQVVRFLFDHCLRRNCSLNNHGGSTWPASLFHAWTQLFSKHSMRRVLFKLIRFSGLPLIFREILYRNKVAILLFHHIGKETAQRTFAYLSKKYNIIGLNDFVDAVNGKTNYVIPPKALIITFDDGLVGNYSILETIKKYRTPITIFLCAGIINTNRHYWFKHAQADDSISELKHLSNKAKLDILDKAGFSLTRNYEYPQALSKQQIYEMKDFVDFQSHSLFHACLPTCNDNEAINEIFTSKEILENEYGLQIYAIAYPNGDYSDRDIELCKKAGYICGLTAAYGFNSLKTNLFRLRRLNINDTDNLDELIVKASGVWALFLRRNLGYTTAVNKEFDP
jgi:peptidoglycan/xylan/chitin deacetylase (PgdA/CDA1 family)